MRFIVNKLLVIGLLGLVLGACSMATDKESSEDRAEETAVETVEAAEETKEESIVANEVTKTFYPSVTRLRDLSEEDLEWYDIIMTRLNAIDDFSGDRETVYAIAEEYGEDPEELWLDWLEIVDAKRYGDMGNYAILEEDYQQLITEILEKNLVGENIEFIGGGYSLNEEKLTTRGHQEIRIDGEAHRISYAIEHRDDFKIAELIEFRVNGGEIDL